MVQEQGPKKGLKLPRRVECFSVPFKLNFMCGHARCSVQRLIQLWHKTGENNRGGQKPFKEI